MMRGVIFDMDGVLVDSHPVHRKAWRTVLASAGRAVKVDVTISSRDYGQVEDFHLTLNHLLAQYVRKQLAERAHSLSAVATAGVDS